MFVAYSDGCCNSVLPVMVDCVVVVVQQQFDVEVVDVEVVDVVVVVVVVVDVGVVDEVEVKPIAKAVKTWLQAFY